MTGANSAVGLRSMPVRYLFLDEVDAYDFDVDGEGDPVSLASQRTITFANRKIFLVSTPTIQGLSRIELEYEQSDRRRWWGAVSRMSGNIRCWRKSACNGRRIKPEDSLLTICVALQRNRSQPSQGVDEYVAVNGARTRLVPGKACGISSLRSE
jgi:phage terminase large subunit GpA-like protein